MTDAFPGSIARWIGGAKLTDVSGKSGDRTYFVDRPGGAYLKIGEKGKFARAAELQRYWARKGLSADAITYVSDDRDYLITAPLAGENGISEGYLAQPERLSRVFGRALRNLHGTDFSDCPVDIMDGLLEGAANGGFSQSHLDALKPFIGDARAEDAAAEITSGKALLISDALLHGDYCLPNIMLAGWRLSGFIDIAEGGKGDRHYDIAWGLWTLGYNLKDPEYGDIFLDAYGRDMIDPARLRICALLSAVE